jgi:hypothetical protein
MPGQHDNADIGVSRSYAMSSLDPLRLILRRHPNVGDDRIGTEAIHGLEQRCRVLDGRDHIHPVRLEPSRWEFLSPA